MKRLSKSIIFVITITLIVSCGRNVEADIETFKNMTDRIHSVIDEVDSKENHKDRIEILSEIADIYSYYVNDANSDEFSLFMKLRQENDMFVWDDVEDLENELWNIKSTIISLEMEIDEM